MYIVTLNRSLNEEQGFLHPNDIIYTVSCRKNLRKFLQDNKGYPVTVFEARKIDIEYILKEEDEK